MPSFFMMSAPKNSDREVTAIPQKTSINLIVHSPTTENGRMELANRVAMLHAAAVIQRLNARKDSAPQKMDLLDAVINAVKKRSQERK